MNNDKIEVKWWEAKQGVTPFLKKQQAEKKQKKHEARKKAAATSEELSKNDKAAPQKNTVLKTKKSVSKTGTHRRAFTPGILENAAEIKAQSSLFNSSNVPTDAKLILENFDTVLSKNLRLTSKQRSLLPRHILELSHLLTDDRTSRRLGYMNSPESLTAYIHYFLRWNLVRLVKLFANLEHEVFNLKDGSVCLDIGSGPLTVPTALFLARPELRSKKITFYCMDISQNALALGEDIFLSTAAALKCEGWNIIRVRGDFGTDIKQKANFISCANVFNEIVDDFKMPPDYLAKKYTEKLIPYADQKNSTILIIEPGVPKASRFVSLMRDALLRKKYVALAPCCHCEQCPMDGKNGGKWCNFAFSTKDAPLELKALSEKAGLAKERAVLSFIALSKTEDAELISKKRCEQNKSLSFRIASDRIALPHHKNGYYACSSLGLLLVLTEEILFSGQMFTVTKEKITLTIDQKSGARIITL